MNLYFVPLVSTPRYKPWSYRVSIIRKYAPCAPDGFTHADTVNALPTPIPGVATLLRPSKLKAPFTLPAPQIPPVSCPVYPLPDESRAILPDPSSKFQYPSNPCVGAPLVPALLTVTVTGLDVIVFPPVSLATAVNVWFPFAVVVVSQLMLYGATVRSAPTFPPSSWNRTSPTDMFATDAVTVMLLDKVAFDPGDVIVTDGVPVVPPVLPVLPVPTVTISAAVNARL
jgi:hypothetical protein